MENNMEFLKKKLKIEFLWPAILLLGIYLKNLSRLSKRYLYTHVHSSVNHNNQKVEII